ncbi:MAG: CBS domain-containing protein [Candidatus Nitrosopolaris sp.]|jgi:CBS domain-containing protein
MSTATISDFMTRRIETISASSSVQEAAKKMKDKDISSLVVIDDRDKPLGLITERDIVRKVCIHDNVTISSVKNAAVLSFPLITIRSDSSPEAAADLLIENKIRHLLVVDKEDADKPVGIITPMDFTRYRDSRKNDRESNANTRILEYYRD